MNSNKRFNLVVAFAVVCIAAFWLSTSVGQSSRSYEVETQVYTTPEYRTDAARAIDAYERVMQRHMDMTQQNLADVLGYVNAIAVRLDAIDARLAKLDERMERIERHMGIAPPPAAPAPDPNAPQPPVPASPPPTVAPAPYGR
jgi:hypothetical protein